MSLEKLRSLDLDDPRRLRLLSSEQVKLLAYLGYLPALDLVGHQEPGFEELVSWLEEYEHAVRVAWFILYVPGGDRESIGVVYKALTQRCRWDLSPRSFYLRRLALTSEECEPMFRVCAAALGYNNKVLASALCRIRLRRNLLPWLRYGVVPRPFYGRPTSYRGKKRYYEHLQNRCKKGCRHCRRNTIII